MAEAETPDAPDAAEAAATPAPAGKGGMMIELIVVLVLALGTSFFVMSKITAEPTKKEKKDEKEKRAVDFNFDTIQVNLSGADLRRVVRAQIHARFVKGEPGEKCRKAIETHVKRVNHFLTLYFSKKRVKDLEGEALKGIVAELRSKLHGYLAEIAKLETEGIEEVYYSEILVQ